MLAEIIPQKILPRILGRFDLVTIYFALIFGSYGAAQMAAQGWAAIPILLVAVATFLVPCALVAYELGTLFPGEGGVYVWAHKTLGPVHGFIAGWLGWVPIFLLLPLGATTVTAHLQFVFGAKWPLWGQILCQLAVVNSVTLISLRKLKISQRYVRVIFFISLGTAVAALIAGLSVAKAATPVGSEIFSVNIFKYGTLYSAAVLWLLGVEVPFNMGDEFSTHKRTAGGMLIWGTTALVIGYLLGIAGILLTTPVANVDGTIGVAVAAGLGAHWLGVLTGLGICVAVVSQGIAYMNSYSRLLFISGVERRLPLVVGHVNERTRVPVPAILVQALGANLIVLLFASQAQLAVAYNIYLAALVAVWCASLYYLYFGIIKARRSLGALYQSRGNDVWKIPGGKLGVWLVALWGIIFNSIGIYYVFALPWTTDISLKGWRIWLGMISLVVILSGVLIFLKSRRKVQQLNLQEEMQRYESLVLPSGH